jgi:hypothetical protein
MKKREDRADGRRSAAAWCADDAGGRRRRAASLRGRLCLERWLRRTGQTAEFRTPRGVNGRGLRSLAGRPAHLQAVAVVFDFVDQSEPVGSLGARVGFAGDAQGDQ